MAGAAQVNITYMKEGITGKLATYLKHLDSIPVLLPANGKRYSGANNSYHVGGGRLVRISEKQANLARIMATDPKISAADAIVKAGYGLRKDTTDAITNDTKISQLRSNFQTKYSQAMSTSTVAYMNTLKANNLEIMGIDKDWVLGQQVALFEEVKREGEYSQAVRLLHDIAQHVDVDAMASNKISVEQTVDYAALLNQADNRTNNIKTISSPIEEI